MHAVAVKANVAVTPARADAAPGRCKRNVPVAGNMHKKTASMLAAPPPDFRCNGNLVTQAAHTTGDQTALRWTDSPHAVVQLPTARRPASAPAPGQTTGAAAGNPVVVLIDDDPDYRAELCHYLRTNGFDAAEFDSFAAALALLEGRPGIFVIVPELTVGSRHLFDNINRLRQADGVAVLVLSGHRDETETIVALELGADDVMPKTTDRREILARIRSAVRRLREHRSETGPPLTTVRQSADQARGAWRFLREQRALIDPDGRPVPLTNAEFSLLEVFVDNAGKELHRDYLSALVLGRPGNPRDRGIDNLVAKLRRKLRDSARLGCMIRTARPVGYVFTGFRGSPE